MVYRMLFILLVIQCFCLQAGAQEQNSEKDSIRYGAIEKFSQKTKLTKLLHGLIFKPVIKAFQPTHEIIANKQKPYAFAEGKIVRKIYFTTLDPFGYSLQDTSIRPTGFIKKAGNQLHMKTRRMVIKDLLLFKSNEPFDSLLVKESERLIRSQSYVQDLATSFEFNSPLSDSVDIYIRVSDVWSILPSMSVSTSNLKVGLTDNNFIGLGNTFHVETEMNNDFEGQVTQISYLVPNFKNSHISANVQYFFSGPNDLRSKEFERPVFLPPSSNLQYQTLGNSHLVKGFELSRSFYSPVAKWAGGLFIGQLMTDQSYIQLDTVRYISSKTNIQDYWGAKSWQLYKGNSFTARTTNLIVSGRILRVRYPDRLPEAEAVQVFNNENIYFAGIGITSRNFIQDRYVFNYGKVEDIPVGRALGITMGLNVKEKNHFYLGLNAAWGNNYRFGYLSSHFEYGTFIGTQGWQQQVITARINYYTPLISLGYWKVRQFVRPTLIIGIDRLPTDNLSLREAVKGFDLVDYPATRMTALTLQTQSYAPWEVYGFRFGPYLFTSLGLLGNPTSGVSDSRLYSVLGLGVLVKNNYLMINTFQLSITFYPFLPGSGANILRLNAYKASDYGFNDFEISKPKVVDYR